MPFVYILELMWPEPDPHGGSPTPEPPATLVVSLKRVCIFGSLVDASNKVKPASTNPGGPRCGGSRSAVTRRWLSWLRSDGIPAAPVLVGQVQAE